MKVNFLSKNILLFPSIHAKIFLITKVTQCHDKEEGIFMPTKTIVPGIIAKTPFASHKYFVISSPIFVGAYQYIVKALPILEEEFNKCLAGKHLSLPLHSKIDGIVCLHDQDVINCEHLTAVDNLDESHRAFAMANAPKKVDL